MRSSRFLSAVLFVYVAFAFTSLLVAQTITGTISGDVTDGTGAVMPGATVTAQNIGTGETRTATTTSTGSYRIPDLAIGKYKVTATGPGFKTVVRTAEVATGAVTHSDFALQVGQRTDTVEVEGSAPLVDLSPNNNNYVDNEKIENVPLNGRDFNSLLAITPGVQRDPGGGFLAVSINGSRTTSNNYFIDGMYNNDRYYGDSAINQTGILGIPAVTFPPDAIEELSVQETPSAEFGVKGGAPILLSMKSGTNTWHGGGTWVNHSGFGDADNFFANTHGDCSQPGDCRPTSIHNNQFHANIGGPIIKDKAFFFLFYEGQRNKSEAVKGRPVPTQKAVDAAIADINAQGLTIDPVGQTLLNYFPIDTNPADQVPCDHDLDNTCTDVGTFTQHTPSSASNNEFGVKFDYKFNPRQSLAVRYIFGDSLQNGPPFAGLPPNPTLPQNLFNSLAPSRAQMAGVNWTWNISNSKILESRFGYTRFSQLIDVNNKIDPKSLGIDTGPLAAADFGIPYVYMYHLGYGGYIGGVQGYPLSTRPDATYDWSEHFSWVKGNHTIKLGGNFQRAVTNSIRNAARTGLAVGYFSPYAPVVAGTYGYLSVQNDIEQLLLGKADLADRSFGDTHRYITQNSVGFYAQDDWKIRPRVTLSYGLRYEINGTMRDKDNKEAVFDPVRGFLKVGTDVGGIHNVDYKDFGPHAGIAWDIFGNGKTALRAGYSLSYDVPNFGSFADPYSFAHANTGVFTQESLGFFNVSNLSDVGSGSEITPPTPTDPTANCYDPSARKGDYICFNSATNGELFSDTPVAPFNAFAIVRNFKTPRAHNFNLSIQRELFRNNVLTVGYSGQRGRDLLIYYDQNATPIGTVNPNSISDNNPKGICSSEAACDPYRPLTSRFTVPGTLDPLIRHLITATNEGTSTYDSLQVSYNQRGWHGFDTEYNFTWSKCFDLNSVNRGGQGNYPQINNDNPVGSPELAHPNFQDGHGLCDHDVRFNFNLSGVYELPDIPHLGRLAGKGWQLSTIYTALSGHPFSVFKNGGSDPSGQGLTGSAIRGEFTGDPIVKHSRDPFNYVSDSFVTPEFGTVGNTPRDFLIGPGLSQWDVTLAKNTKIGDKLNVQLRWEVYNVLNRGNFSRFSLDNGINSATFGHLLETPDVAAGNPVIAQGGPRNMNLSIKISF